MSIAVDQKALVRSLRNYLAGQAVGITRDETLLDELLKCAFCLRHAGSLAGRRRSLEETYATAFEEIKTTYSGVFDKGERITLAGEHLERVHDTLSSLDFDRAERDIVADIYESFVGARYRGQEGQFFTPANAVRVLVELTDPSSDDVVIDPACGAGAFLLQAGLHASNKNGEQPELYGVDKDGYLARLAQMHLALQFKQLFPVECADSLTWSGGGLRKRWADGPEERFSLVLTNPPFGSKIVALAEGMRSEYALAHKWLLNRKTRRYEKTAMLATNAPPQVLFLERCLGLLEEGGRLGIVLPESVLSNVRHRHVVQYLLDHAMPEAVLGMPEALFKTSGKGGTHTKVCLLVVRKGRASNARPVFMAEARWCGHDSRGRSIDKDELPEIMERYKEFADGRLTEQDRLGFSVEHDQLERLVLAPKYHDPEPRKLTGRLGASHHLLAVDELLSSGQLEITTGHEVGKLAYGTGDVPFVRTTDLSNWEIKVDPKHCLSEEIYEAYADKQDVREGDLLVVRDGTYLIGTAAYITEHDTRIVYQSHLYKLRLRADELLNPFLLLAILSGAPVRAQIRSLAFTQDIIDSLGDRIREVLLPVPRSARVRKEVTSTVRRVITDRVEARELARRSVLLVAS
jgi:type I restriction enzyme M protein